jgi:hypothetical protein
VLRGTAFLSGRIVRLGFECLGAELKTLLRLPEIAGMDFLVAGAVKDTNYFRNEIRPKMDGSKIKVFGRGWLGLEKQAPHTNATSTESLRAVPRCAGPPVVTVGTGFRAGSFNDHSRSVVLPDK